MDYTVQGIAKSRTRLSHFHFQRHFEKYAHQRFGLANPHQGPGLKLSLAPILCLLTQTWCGPAWQIMPLVSRGTVTLDFSFNGTDLFPCHHSVAFIKIQAQNMSIGGNGELLRSYTCSQKELRFTGFSNESQTQANSKK